MNFHYENSAQYDKAMFVFGRYKAGLSEKQITAAIYQQAINPEVRISLLSPEYGSVEVSNVHTLGVELVKTALRDWNSSPYLRVVENLVAPRENLVRGEFTHLDKNLIYKLAVNSSPEISELCTPDALAEFLKIPVSGNASKMVKLLWDKAYDVSFAVIHCFRYLTLLMDLVIRQLSKSGWKLEPTNNSNKQDIRVSEAQIDRHRSEVANMLEEFSSVHNDLNISLKKFLVWDTRSQVLRSLLPRIVVIETSKGTVDINSGLSLSIGIAQNIVSSPFVLHSEFRHPPRQSLFDIFLNWYWDKHFGGKPVLVEGSKD